MRIGASMGHATIAASSTGPWLPLREVKDWP
jgi:hypothetical protein